MFESSTGLFIMGIVMRTNEHYTDKCSLLKRSIQNCEQAQMNEILRSYADKWRAPRHGGAGTANGDGLTPGNTKKQMIIH